MHSCRARAPLAVITFVLYFCARVRLLTLPCVPPSPQASGGRRHTRTAQHPHRPLMTTVRHCPFRRLATATAMIFVAFTPIGAQKAAAPAASWPERAVRHDIPMTNAIRRAFAAGTRDSTGRPGRNYWQLRTDYTIDAKLDSATKTISGRERIVLQNNSDSALGTVQLRLDQNLFAPNVPRSETLPELTDGMHLTKLAVDGVAVDTVAPEGEGRGRNAPPLPTPFIEGFGETSARIHLVKPIPAKGSATLDVEWNFRVPNVPAGERGMRMGRWGDTLYQVAQWYPRVAVYDDLRGWDTDPYLSSSEFYNNFGRFDVNLNVPAGWIVGSSGTLQNAEMVLSPVARGRLSHVLDS